MQTNSLPGHAAPATVPTSVSSLDAIGIARLLWPQRVRLIGLSIGLGAVALAVSFAISPTFTARAAFISPQQQQNAAAAALQSLGALSGLAGSAAGLKSPADQYVSLMQSTTMSDRIVDRFNLVQLYDRKFRVDARRELASNVRIAAGKKDNLIAIEVDDHDPKRAADMANAYIEELRKLTNSLALTEAQQRRVFFEDQLTKTKGGLTQAQQRLQKSGYNPGAMKSEPKAAAEAYARAKAEMSSQEMRLAAMRRTLTENAPEIQQALAVLSGLRAEVNRMERPDADSTDQDYVAAYREYKYQEALFEVYSRQFELAKLDEAREGTLIQVLDVATPPERKSAPKRAIIGLLTTFLTLIGASAFIVCRRVLADLR
jgi:uncharacterized protein involved in exopolysaccharide biosynthesis